MPPPPSRPEPRIGETARVLARRAGPEEFDEDMRRVRRQGAARGLRKVVGLAILLALASVAFFTYRAWESSITAMFQSAPAPATQASKEAAQTRPKIADRIGGARAGFHATGGDAPAPRLPSARCCTNNKPIRQERKQYVGSVIWRTETTSPGPGQAPDTAVKAEVDIPERQMRMSFDRAPQSR